MGLLTILMYMFVILGIVGMGLIILAVLCFIYGWVEGMILKRKIPDRIKKEVEENRYENERRKQRAGECIRRDATNRDNEQTAKQWDISIPETSNNARAVTDSKIHWADFS